MKGRGDGPEVKKKKTASGEESQLSLSDSVALKLCSGLLHTLKVVIKLHLLKTASPFNKRFLFGEPQGRIIRPLLFLIYVNDLSNCLEHFQVIMYADDTVIYFGANCCQNIEYHLNADLSNLAEWMNNNYLTLNTWKLKFVLFGGDNRMKTCQGIKLVIDHENLESKDSIKYLGVVIHKNLTWNEHIESSIAKVNQRIGLLNLI